MTITVELPDDLTTHENFGREALVALAIEGYRSGKLTHRQAARMLDLYWLDFEGLLKERGVVEGAYDVEAFEQDCRTMDSLRAQGTLGK
jgi:predicted HTH domain antitoxin